MSAPLTAHAFRALVDRCAAARDSLASCRSTLDEIEREGAALERVTAELQAATLQRPSAELERERVSMLQSVGRTAEFRLAQVRQIRADTAAHRKRLGARHDVPGELRTDGQKSRAWSPAQCQARAEELAVEEADLDAFLKNLTPEQRAEMERDCAPGADR